MSIFHHDSCGVGFVCNIKGEKSYNIIKSGLEVLERLSHRGATGADPKTGDGAGILIQQPDEFLRAEADKNKIGLPQSGQFACGLVFFPANKKDREFCEENFKKILKESGLIFLGFRNVPTNNSIIGETAKKTEPVIKHIFIGAPSDIQDQNAFEIKLYIARRGIENLIRNSKVPQKSFFYIPSLSSRTLAFKGLLMPNQLRKYFLDLEDKNIKSCLALVHSRYSTNTFPAWDLAQPFRYLAHNGEINTLSGNINWMKARESSLAHELFGKDIKKIFPVIVPDSSDSASIDNALELLILAGRPIYHAMMMLIPPSWEKNKLMNENHKYFYEYHSCLTEPWDGPAAIAFTDGRFIGGILDRNGLRPCRYTLTSDDEVVMASEAGVLDISAEDKMQNGRLEPGKIFLIDTKEGRILKDDEIKNLLASKNPYKKWIIENSINISSLPKPKKKAAKIKNKLFSQMQRALGYSKEDINMLIKPMVEKAQEPVGSMGDDTPLAVLSKKPRLLYNYFKQLFAQVTNPPIDPIREEIVMSLSSFIGPEKNLLKEGAQSCSKLRIDNPILKDEDLNKIKNIKVNGFKTRTISMLFEYEKGIPSFKNALKRICTEASNSVKNGYSFIILSDRGLNKKNAAIPALLALSTAHHHLIRERERTKIGLIIESAEPREIMHFALLFGYGADAINPYFAYENIQKLCTDKETSFGYEDAKRNYIKAVEKGILKILSKMGISTLQSYRGAQIFEAIGIKKEVVDVFFTGTVSRIEGIGLGIIAKDTILRHKQGFYSIGKTCLNTGGIYQWRRTGETHLWNPDTIFNLQQAARNNDISKYREFANLINNQMGYPSTIRGILKFKKTNPIKLDEVEPASEIVKRFVTGAMSFGSISKEAHETIAIAMNRLKGMSNTGEGGEDPQRFISLKNGDSVRSAVKQVASGRFGVTNNYLSNADEIQIKIAQGAKPGEGGQLPGHKVNEIIARTRFSIPGVTLISPPPHHDIYSIEDLAQLIFDLKNVNPKARISVKLVSEIGVGTIAAGVAKGHADMILISGGDGGTGASPLSSIKHAGLPWELGISETHQTLVLNDLRSRVRLQTDGQMRTGRDVAIAAMLGAEEFGFCTAILVVLGCVMLRHCNLNNCSVGVATQENILRKRFSGKPEYIQNYLTFVAEEIRSILADLGIKKVDDLIGRSDLLELNKGILHEKARAIDISRILYKPQVPSTIGIRCAKAQDHEIEKILDISLIEKASSSLEKKEKVFIDSPIKNTDRTAGAMLSGRVSQLFGEEGLPEDTIRIKFLGTAGQSFGAFLSKGITLELEGDANDYVGKGLSGGKIIIYPNKNSVFKPEENIIIGNTTFYGATQGEAYIRGIAGERFCIRNSGANAVVEGIGDHGCEYMTRGNVIVLGKTGRNFGAGMSGGIAYMYNAKSNNFSHFCNMDMVELEELNNEDKKTIFYLLSNHLKFTGSSIAETIIDDFDIEASKFIKVMPKEYKRILELGMRKDKVLKEELEG